MDAPRFIPLPHWRRRPAEEISRRMQEFCAELRERRTVRDYATEPVPRELIEQAILAAGSAPSGANRQPWHFVVVGDPALKRRIREGAEIEERDFYEHRAPPDWLEALAPLGTTADKPFLETAPWLIAVFSQKHAVAPDGRRLKNYYPIESTGIATGFLIAALHRAGLATLTHTPSPMKFLNEILGRPVDEKPFLLLVVGYPAQGAQVPDIRRKALEEIVTFR